jgi:hypothetical protein
MSKPTLSAFVLVVLAGLWNPAARAQVNDAGLWVSLNLEKRVTPAFSLHLSDELRLNENISEAGTHFTEFGGEHMIFKGLSGGVYYRFIQRRRLDDSYSKRHRFFAELSYKRKIGKISVALRERVQSQYKDLHSSDNGKIPEYYLRSKLTLRTKIIKRTQAFANTEVFYQLSNPKGNEVDQIRTSAGLEYKINPGGSIEAFYMINKEVRVSNPVTDYIIGLGYSYTF